MNTAPHPLNVRPLEKSDFSFALAQTAREGWDTTRETLEIHLVHDPAGCSVAEVDGRPVGMVTTTRFHQSGWMGELIVSPDHRRRGIGTVLMEYGLQCLEASGLNTIRLEADPPGISIYKRLGFAHEFLSPRFRIEKVPRISSGIATTVTSSGLAEIAAFDEPHFGDDRKRLLGEIFIRARAVFRSPAMGAPQGYLVVQRSAAGARIGPLVAVEPEVAEDLLRTALAELESETVVIALPGVNTNGIALLERLGFVATPPSYRMVRGAREATGKPECIYAVASGAFG